MRKSNKLVQGIGIKGTDYPSKIEGVILKEYSLWQQMLHRCTKAKQAKFPTYIGTSCSDNFKSYSYFYEWCQEQVGFGNKEENGCSWHLDKDILIKGNKLYSEDTCVFVPPRVNSLLVKCDASRGDCPVGVSFNNQCGNYKSVCNVGKGESVFLGRHSTPQEAFQAYKAFKEDYIKEVAVEYKHQIDERVYKALMNYTVEITD